MSYQTHYGGIIWTNHALERLSQRGIPQDAALQAFQQADTTLQGKHGDSLQYQKKFGNKTVTLIVKQNERNESIVLSVWMDPPLPWTKDYKEKQAWKKYQKASFWGKVWYTLRKQLGW